jgi:hypothetical protein
MKKWTILLIVTLITLSGILFLYQQLSKKSEFALDKPDFRMQASELFREFEMDERLATKKYTNKVIEVKGNISEVFNNQDNSIVILFKEKDAVFGVNCSIKTPEKNKSSLQPGDSVTIIGILQGSLDDVILTNCKIKN